MANSGDKLVIEITSDFVCPWCLVGETRLQEAIKQAAPQIDIELNWRPYELNADMPAAGMDRREYLTHKFGGPDKLNAIDERLKSIGADDGIGFRPDLIQRSPNTLKAHRLNWLAAQQGHAKVLASLILNAYFTEGQDIGDNAVLTKLAVKAGMDAKKVAAFLESDEGTKEVRAMEAQGASRGIQGVPFITIGDEEIHGAQGVEDMVEVLQRALKARRAA